MHMPIYSLFLKDKQLVESCLMVTGQMRISQKDDELGEP